MVGLLISRREVEQPLDSVRAGVPRPETDGGSASRALHSRVRLGIERSEHRAHHACLREPLWLLPPAEEAGEAGEEAGPQKGNASLAPGVEEPKKRRTPAVDWAGLLRRRFAWDIFACAHCAGRLKGAPALEARREPPPTSDQPR
jgi:hypothetical protein